MPHSSLGYRRPARKFCTPFHRNAQSSDHNLIDGADGKHYLARQIEPGSLRTLRLGLEGAASLTAVAPRTWTAKLEAFSAPFGGRDKPNGDSAARWNREGWKLNGSV
jgi:hypothetical protein